MKDRLKSLRVSINLTQAELAKIINKTTAAYGFYEIGRNEPDLATIRKLADYFDVSLDFLIGRPHPHDLPMVATQVQRELINHILQLDDSLCEKVEAYICGLDDGKKQQQQTISNLMGK